MESKEHLRIFVDLNYVIGYVEGLTNNGPQAQKYLDKLRYIAQHHLKIFEESEPEGRAGFKRDVSDVTKK